MILGFKSLLVGALTVSLLIGCGTTENTTDKNEQPKIVTENKQSDNTIQKENKQLNNTIQQENKTNNLEQINDLKEEKKEVVSNNNILNNNEKLEELMVHFIDVGQADATLFEFNENGEEYTVLIDTGDVGANDTVDYLNKEGIKELDLVIGTHAHADHIGQMDKVIQNFNVQEVWMNGDTSTSAVFNRAVSSIDKYGIEYYEPKSGEEFDIGKLEIEVLHPDKLGNDTNNNSIAMRLTYGDISFMFTGDAEEETEELIVSRFNDLQADILHVPHHGSDTSTSTALLNKVNPEVAIYSAGLGNSYGHPVQSVVDKILNKGIKLYGTDKQGTILLTTNGETYNITTEKQGTITINPNSTKETEVVEKETNNQTNNSCIDINSASKEELIKITHIAEERAEEIISSRPFTSVDGLDNISGIGKSRLDDIKAEGLACVK